jgi:hypothetical protein
LGKILEELDLEPDLDLESNEKGARLRSRQEREKEKKVEQRRPERSSAAAQIKHGVAACKEVNLEL